MKKKYDVLTKNNFSYSSLDFEYPEGSKLDNASGIPYIELWENFIGCNEHKKLKVLDIGCAGGQNVLEWNSRGHVAIGIEGSDCPIVNSESKGYNNWRLFKDIYLFNADLTKPYVVLEDGVPMKFDLISCWEVIEHIDEKDADDFFKFIDNHLADDGIFIGSIATDESNGHDYPDINYHVNIKDKLSWCNYLASKFFLFNCYPVSLALRQDATSHPMIPLDKPHPALSFAFYAKKKK